MVCFCMNVCKCGLWERRLWRGKLSLVDHHWVNKKYTIITAKKKKRGGGREGKRTTETFTQALTLPSLLCGCQRDLFTVSVFSVRWRWRFVCFCSMFSWLIHNCKRTYRPKIIMLQYKTIPVSPLYVGREASVRVTVLWVLTRYTSFVCFLS